MKIWTHASALSDYRLLVVKALLRLVLVTPWAFSAFGLSVWFVGILNKAFGVVSPVAWSKTWIMLLYTLTLFLLWDLSRYLLHRLLHAIPFLWEIHKVHHSAEVLTPFTLYRNHPIESMLYIPSGDPCGWCGDWYLFLFFQNASHSIRSVEREYFRF